MPDDPRLAQLRLWLPSRCGFDPGTLEVVSADASFRRYFRARREDGQWWVVMDAPPDKEDLATYLRVSALLEGCGVHVPQVLAADTVAGYAVIEDMGNRHADEIESRLTILLMHLLKWKYQPGNILSSWTGTIREQRLRIAMRLKKMPSLKGKTFPSLRITSHDSQMTVGLSHTL